MQLPWMIHRIDACCSDDSYVRDPDGSLHTGSDDSYVRDPDGSLHTGSDDRHLNDPDAS